MTLPFPVPRRLFGVEHHFLELGAAQIHYVTAGSGETALLLHGNPSWSFLYRKIIAGLKDEFRCVAPDFPGYGMSTAAPGFSFLPREQSQLLERLAGELGLTNITLMVQDWGGPHRPGLRRPPARTDHPADHRQHVGLAAGPRAPGPRVQLADGRAGRQDPHPRVQLRAQVLLPPRLRAAGHQGSARSVPRAMARPAPPRTGCHRPPPAHRRIRVRPRGRSRPAHPRRSAHTDRVGGTRLRVPPNRARAIRIRLPPPPDSPLPRRLTLPARRRR